MFTKDKNREKTVEKSKITKAMLGRLPQYLSLLKALSEKDSPFISATRIAGELSLGEVQVRKDLSIVCGKGKPKRGYRISDLISSIETCLGQTQITSAVLVGAGKLGKALLEYDEFEKYGVQIQAAFDCNEQVLKLHTSLEVLPMTQLESYCRENRIQIGIITVGEGSAQTVCDQMLACGITAIWNFAPCKLKVPEGIVFLQENLALSLAYLNNQLMEKNGKENPDRHEIGQSYRSTY